MSWLSRLLKKNRMERELESELRFHFQRQIADNMRDGMTEEAARRAARLQFGGVDQIKEECRDARGTRWLEVIVQNVRFALRTMRKDSLFTAAAVISLAIGIGANTAIFSVIDALMLRTLDAEHPEQLMNVTSNGIISNPVFEEMKARQNTFSGLLASTGPQRFNFQWNTKAEAQPLMGAMVSENYFSVLGVRLIAGPGFGPADNQPQAAAVAVISAALWQRIGTGFPVAGYSDLLGQRIVLNGKPTTIAGVAAPGFRGDTPGFDCDVWVLINQFRPTEDLRNRGLMMFQLMGRLSPGVKLEYAAAELTQVYQQELAGEQDAGGPSAIAARSRPTDYHILLEPGGRGFPLVGHEFGYPLLILLAIVALVLLLACANVANLLLARAVARQHEIGVRLALGASRLRLTGQLMTESTLLAVCAGGVGLLIAISSRNFIRLLLESGAFPITLHLDLNLTVLAFTSTVAVLAALIFGLVPALQATRKSVTPSLSGNTRMPSASRPRQGFAKGLIVAQIAVSLLLLVTGGLLVNSLRHIYDVDPGFDREGVLLIELQTDDTSEPAGLSSLVSQLRDRVAALPGVTDVSCSWLPLFDPLTDLYAQLKIDGYTPGPGERVFARYNSVSPDYFQTVGMKLISGRDFTARDEEKSAPVVIVNERFVQKYFSAGQNPLGQLVYILAHSNGDRIPREIVGVIRDAKYNDLRGEVRPMFYAPLPQLPRPIRSIEVRTASGLNPALLGGNIRALLTDITPHSRVDQVRTVAQQVDRRIAIERLIAELSAVFGLVALLLAVVGLYGTLSYSVARRTREFGVCIALGATRTAVVRSVLKESLGLTMIGITVGLVLTFAATRLVSNFLYGLRATDPVTVIVAILILLIGTILASYFPARRASKLDPLVALRYE